jgi:hypothetical protein
MTICSICQKTIMNKEPGSVTYVKDINDPDFCKCKKAKFPHDWHNMLEATQLIISEIRECIKAADWVNLQMALMGFALAIRDETIREINRKLKP